jgi:hypothetical protein
MRDLPAELRREAVENAVDPFLIKTGCFELFSTETRSLIISKLSAIDVKAGGASTLFSNRIKPSNNRISLS